MGVDWTDWVLHPAMAVIAWTYRRRLMLASNNVETTQLGLLRSILSTNQATQFGTEHSFSSITDWTSFREKVPVQSYASLEPYIQQQIETGETALVASPLISLARTSGTTGPTKDIPMTAKGLEIIKDAQYQLALTLYQQTGFFDGKILALFSPHVEGRLKNGLAYGASSGQADRNTSFLFRSKYVYPPEIAAISDYDLKYYLYVLFGLLEENVTGVATANPSSLCRLAEIANERRDDLTADLKSGEISNHRHLPADKLADQFRALVLARKRQVDKVLAILDSAGELRLSDFWPNLAAVAVWTGGSCAVALGKLKRIAPAHTKFVELGYRASEFIGSINIDADRNICLPTLQHTVFEFVEQKVWEVGEVNFTPMSELQEGSNYYVFVTTSSGLYRYDINDVVHVDGYHGACPSIRFLQKGKGVTSITGEKLYTHQVLEAVTSMQHEFAATLDFCLVLADENAAAYCALIEGKHLDIGITDKLAPAFDRFLMEVNSEYADKRGSGRLKAPKILLLKTGTGEAIKRHAINGGQRESQYKPPTLEYASKFDFDLVPWLEAGQPG